MKEGIAKDQGHTGVFLQRPDTDLTVFRIGNLHAALDGVVQGIAEKDAKIQRLCKVKQASVQVRNAGDFFLLADGQLFVLY